MSAAATPSLMIANMTIAEFLSELIAQDNGILTMQLLTVMRNAKTAIPAEATATKAEPAAVVKTIASLINITNQADGHQVNIESVALVAAAKHGCPSIVEAVLTTPDMNIPVGMAIKAFNEAQQNKQIAIVELLNQSVVADDGAHQLVSDASVDAEAPDTGVGTATPNDTENAGAAVVDGSEATAAVVNENPTV